MFTAISASGHPYTLSKTGIAGQGEVTAGQTLQLGVHLHCPDCYLPVRLSEPRGGEWVHYEDGSKDCDPSEHKTASLVHTVSSKGGVVTSDIKTLSPSSTAAGAELRRTVGWQVHQMGTHLPVMAGVNRPSEDTLYQVRMYPISQRAFAARDVEAAFEEVRYAIDRTRSEVAPL